MLELEARGGRRCVTRGLNIRGENGGVLLSLCSAAWNMQGGTCRLSRPVRRGCRPESLSEVPGKVAGLAFPRPLEGSSRRRCRVVVEESLAEESVWSVRCFAAISWRVSWSHCVPSEVPQAASRRSRRRRVAFTTRSLRGVRSCVARSRARLSRQRFPVG